MGVKATLLKKYRRLPCVDRKFRRMFPLPYTKDGIDFRFLSKEDSIEELTNLINRAYLVYEKDGLAYKGVTQSAAETKQRVRNSYTVLAEKDNKIIGTISYKPPWECRGSSWFNRPGVAKSNQLAVDPDYQSLGLGGELIDLVELFAVLHGAEEIASDHAEEAEGYISWKKKRGYRFIDFHSWSFTNYRSVILSKNLDEFST